MKKSLLKRLFGSSKAKFAQPKFNIKMSKGLNILVVDDSRTQLYALNKMLSAEGVKVHTAENGKQGILMARHVKPDLILMDIVMPEINGFQATRYLTRQPDTHHIPIIMISGSEQESDRAWGLKLGAKDYLAKPVEKQLLIQKIVRWTAKLEEEKLDLTEHRLVG